MSPMSPMSLMTPMTPMTPMYNHSVLYKGALTVMKIVLHIDHANLTGSGSGSGLGLGVGSGSGSGSGSGLDSTEPDIGDTDTY